MREADRVVFVGYGLPDDDVEVVYLLKRSLAHLGAAAITVVEFDQNDPTGVAADHAAGRRFRTLFGDALNRHAGGLGSWLEAGAPGLA